MIKYWKDIRDYLFVFLLTILFAYIIGLTIITVINKRLTDISINVPTPQVNINWSKSGPQPAPENIISEPKHQGIQGIQEGYTNLSPSSNLNHYSDDLRGLCNQKEYSDCTEATSQVEMEKDEQLNRVCYFRHDHWKYLCTYGVTNYLNPQQIDPINRRLYQHNYFPNMTLQDYINWLWLYEKESEKLCYEHYRNLEKIKNGKSLKYQKGVCPPNLTADGSKCHTGIDNDIGKYYQEVMKYVDLDNMNGTKNVPGYNVKNYSK